VETFARLTPDRGGQDLSAKDSKIAAKAIRDVIEYIEVSHLRGGPEAHSTVQDNYYGDTSRSPKCPKLLSFGFL